VRVAVTTISSRYGVFDFPSPAPLAGFFEEASLPFSELSPGALTP